MNHGRYHQILRTSPGSKLTKKLHQSLGDSGFIPLTDVVGEAIKSHIGWLGPVANIREPLAIRSEVFVNPEAKQLIAYREPGEVARQGRSSIRNGVDFLVAVADGELEPGTTALRSVVAVIGDQDIGSGSLQEQNLALSTAESLQKPSPNGKRLSDDEFLTECKQLIDNDTRGDLQTLQRTFQDTPVTRENLELLERFSSNPKRTMSLLNDSSLMSVEYGAKCRGCEDISLVFGDRSSCASIIAGSGARCVQCRNESFEIIELYRPKKVLVEALQQGLWLEALGLDCLKNRTNHVWAGHMAGSDEVDAIAVYADQVVLLECKDTSFGQNEFYVARAKAENVDATQVCVLTTRDIHANVESVIKQANEARQGVYRQRARQYHVVTNSDAKKLQQGLSDWLEKLDQQVLKGWFASLRLPSYIYYDLDL